MTTDTSEKGLETLIMRHMTGVDGFGITPGLMGEKPEATGTGYFAGSPKDYDRAHALDVAQLLAFLRVTQLEAFKKLAIGDDPKDINRLKFLARLSTEIGKRALSTCCARVWSTAPTLRSVLRHTVTGQRQSGGVHAENRFSITRQLAYSMDETRRALDLGLFINGLPIATFELKTASLSRRWRTPSGSTSATATRASAYSASAAAWSTLRWTIARSACARS